MDLAAGIGGAIFTMTALTLIALVTIRRWITDTTTERRNLGDAIRDAEADRMRYVAAQAAIEAERGRLQRDVAAERQQITARLEAERAAMRDHFEEERAKLICETVEATVGLVRDGLLDTNAPEYARIIGFPSPAHQRAAEEPARGRGATRG